MGWPQNAYVGQKVVCIKLENDDFKAGVKGPDLNEVVTISWVGLETGLVRGKFEKSIVIDLVEYPAPETAVFRRGWLVRYFRPVQSTESGMKVLNAILKNVNKARKALVGYGKKEKA